MGEHVSGLVQVGLIRQGRAEMQKARLACWRSTSEASPGFRVVNAVQIVLRSTTVIVPGFPPRKPFSQQDFPLSADGILVGPIALLRTGQVLTSPDHFRISHSFCALNRPW